MSGFAVTLAPTSTECRSSPSKNFSIPCSGRLVTAMWRFSAFWSVSQTSLLTQFSVFSRLVHLSRASIAIYACENPLRISCRVFWSWFTDGYWWSPQRLYRSANSVGIPPRRWENCEMRDRMSLSWSCRSLCESLPSKKKYAIARCGFFLESLLIIAELRRQLINLICILPIKKRLTIECFYRFPLWNF